MKITRQCDAQKLIGFPVIYSLASRDAYFILALVGWLTGLLSVFFVECEKNENGNSKPHRSEVEAFNIV